MSIQEFPRVLIDACLLVKGNVSNIFFDLAKSGLVHLHWTPEIGAEFVKNWKKIRLAQARIDPLIDPGAYALADASFELKARDRLEKFKLMQPEWEIPSWNFQTATSKRPPKCFGIPAAGEQQHGGVHPGDYHVALASTILADDFSDDEIWLATENIKHLPSNSLKNFDVWAAHQGLILEAVFSKFPQSVERSLAQTIAESGNPKLTQQAMVDILASENGIFSTEISTHMQKTWDCQPATVITQAVKHFKMIGKQSK